MAVAEQVSEEELAQLVAFLKVLADKTRLRILGLLAEREHTVRELAAIIGVKEPTMSWHLVKLQGLVEMRQDKTSHYYRLRQEDVHTLLRELSAKADTFAETESSRSEAELKTLRHFFADGRLREIPQSRSKMLIVLKRLVEEFDFGTHYTEKQVNEILKRFHPDCATLRRQMVDNRLMARENSVYWRSGDTAPGSQSAENE